jgi:hypothetical protein
MGDASSLVRDSVEGFAAKNASTFTDGVTKEDGPVSGPQIDQKFSPTFNKSDIQGQDSSIPLSTFESRNLIRADVATSSTTTESATI